MTPAENPYAGQGPVLIDVGGDVGALLVTMPASFEGVEIEIRPHQGDNPSHSHSNDHVDHSHVSHVEVLPRPTPGGVVYCAVFPSMRQGRYELYERPSGPIHLQVTITGGQVTQASWPTESPPATL